MHQERGHSDIPHAPLQCSPFRRTHAVRKIKQLKNKELQIVHFPMPSANILENVKLQFQSHLNSEQTVFVKDYGEDVLKIAVDQIKGDSNIMDDLANSNIIESVIKSEPNLIPDSAFNVQIRSVINSAKIQNSIQPVLTSDGLSIQNTQVIQSGQEITELETCAAGQTANMQPSHTLPIEVEGNENYIVSGTGAETVIASHNLQQALGQQPLNILKVEGEDQPYFLIQGQGGSITMLQSLPIDGVSDESVPVGN
jgi:hypothetical protein